MHINNLFRHASNISRPLFKNLMFSTAKIMTAKFSSKKDKKKIKIFKLKTLLNVKFQAIFYNITDFCLI